MSGLSMHDAAAEEERRFPPVTELGMASLALIIAGGIILSANLPKGSSTTVPTILLIASAALLALNLGLLARVPGFAWDRFLSVGRWSLLAYAVTAGMIEYAFLQDHIHGRPLVIATLSLVIFAVHVPILVAFTVAREHAPDL